MTEHEAGLRRVRARVEGRVQGVGFRYFVARKAEEMGVNGWVRNRFDGSVELEAEAAATVLQQFVQAVRKGPRGSFVSDLDLEWAEFEGRYNSFKIRQTG